MTTVPTTDSPSFSPAMDAAEATRQRLGAYLEALNAGGDITPFLHDDVEFTIVGGPEARGSAAVAATIGAIHNEMFDSSVEVRRTICERDHAAAELVFTGTHTGEFAGIPATGRRVEVPYAVSYDLAADGRATAIRVYLPMHVLLAQLGGAPS
jgi:steroid delta-isomerase-like uncharacterized protein